MARELSSRLDLDEPEETRLYNAYADWWRELQAALDADGDGRVSRRVRERAVASLAGPALIRVAEVPFDVTDKDGNQQIDADEYRALFRTAFHRDTTSTGGTYSRSAFTNDFLTFMSGHLRTHPLRPPPRRSMTGRVSGCPRCHPSESGELPRSPDGVSGSEAKGGNRNPSNASSANITPPSTRGTSSAHSTMTPPDTGATDVA